MQDPDAEIRALRRDLAVLKEGVDSRASKRRGRPNRDEKENLDQSDSTSADPLQKPEPAPTYATAAAQINLEAENASLRAINLELKERLRAAEDHNELLYGRLQEALELLRRAAEGDGTGEAARPERRRFAWLEEALEGDEDYDPQAGFEAETLGELQRQVQELRIANADLKSRLREQAGSPALQRRSVEFAAGSGGHQDSPARGRPLRRRSGSGSGSGSGEGGSPGLPHRHPWTGVPPVPAEARPSFDGLPRSRSASPTRSAAASAGGRAATPGAGPGRAGRAQWCAVAPPRPTFEELQRDLNRKAAAVPALRERIRKMGLLPRETPAVAIERAIEEHVRTIKRDFGELGIGVPVRRVRGTTYLVAGRKVQLFYRGDQLLVQTGGGACSFWSFLHEMQQKAAQADGGSS